MKKRKQPEMTAEEEAAATAESLRRNRAVNEMYRLAQARFPGLWDACVTPRWERELAAYMAEPLERGAG